MKKQIRHIIEDEEEINYKQRMGLLTLCLSFIPIAWHVTTIHAILSIRFPIPYIYYTSRFLEMIYRS